MTTPNKPAARVEAHLQKLREAGLDTQKFFAALVDIRDDSALSAAHRDALYRVVAMESFLWYLDAINGAPLDREKMLEEARKLLEASAAKQADPPKKEVTVRERPPKKK